MPLASDRGEGLVDEHILLLDRWYVQCDLAVVANAFSKLYEQSLSEFISDDCGGDYKSLLIGVTGNCWSALQTTSAQTVLSMQRRFLCFYWALVVGRTLTSKLTTAACNFPHWWYADGSNHYLHHFCPTRSNDTVHTSAKGRWRNEVIAAIVTPASACPALQYTTFRISQQWQIWKPIRVWIATNQLLIVTLPTFPETFM